MSARLCISLPYVAAVFFYPGEFESAEINKWCDDTLGAGQWVAAGGGDHMFDSFDRRVSDFEDARPWDETWVEV